MNQLPKIVSSTVFAVVDLVTVSRLVLASVLSVGVLVYLRFFARRKKGP